MKRFFLLCSLVFILLTPLKSKGSGVPVVDVVSITQQIMGYIQDLADYTVQLQTLAKDTQQYLQMLKDYKQTVLEYKHYLNQLKGVKHLLSDNEWRSIVQTTKGSYGSRGRSVMPELDHTHDSFVDDVRTETQGSSTVVLTQAEYDRLMVNSGRRVGSSQSQVLNRLYAESQKAWDQDVRSFEQLSINQESTQKRLKEIETLARSFDSLGDESDLATLQHLALTNHMIIKQNEELLLLKNQEALENTRDKEYEREAKKRALRAKYELERIERSRADREDSLRRMRELRANRRSR